MLPRLICVIIVCIALLLVCQGVALINNYFLINNFVGVSLA